MTGPRRDHRDRWAVVALGANLADPARNLSRAIDHLADRVGPGLLHSSLWTSSPVDCPPDSPAFVNAVAAFPLPDGLAPESFLDWTQALEREFGRRPKVVLNEARPLDIDLIAWGAERRNAPRLILPHPRAHLRRFVLEPLAEILPDLVLPGQTRTVAELLPALGTGEVLRRIGPPARGPDGQREAGTSGSMSGV